MKTEKFKNILNQKLKESVIQNDQQVSTLKVRIKSISKSNY